MEIFLIVTKALASLQNKKALAFTKIKIRVCFKILLYCHVIHFFLLAKKNKKVKNQIDLKCSFEFVVLNSIKIKIKF